jgi:hypothetical protein
VDVNKVSDHGATTALNLCLNIGDARIDCLRELLKHPSIDVNLPSGSYSGARRSPLETVAVACRADESRALLLRHPALEVNARNQWGNTVLQEVASDRTGNLISRDLWCVVEDLLKHPDIDLDVKNRNGQTARGAVAAMEALHQQQAIEVPSVAAGGVGDAGA